MKTLARNLAYQELLSVNISRVYKHGVDIFRVQGKGYQLANPMQLLNQDIIQAQTNNHVDLIPIIDSTNQYLLIISIDWTQVLCVYLSIN